ncbi:MAG: acetyltransferase [Microbacterium sp.]|nr:MAG: acetyltransferase [Microbacterium sp.]
MTPPLAPRYAGLDGLRAVAVLLVVVYHLFPGWLLHSGFVGVDVFFVISGFLITSLLVREHARSGRIALGSFWKRRARRLLPALALVVTVSASVAWMVGGDVLVGIGRQVLGAATFSYNWVAVADGASYFGATQPELFRNLWSLAVEEQFYVLWPLLLPLLLVVRSRWMRAAVALTLAAASAGWAVALLASGAGLTRAYYGTDTHAFGLLLGVALAVVVAGRGVGAAADAASGARQPRAMAVALAGTAVAVTLVVVAAWPGGTGLYPGIPLAASVLSAAAIALAVRPGSPVGRALDIAPLRWIGERSYGIYLWHWPIVVLLGVMSGSFVDSAIPVSTGVAALVLTLVASAASYRLIEQPVRQLGFRGALRALGARLASTPARRFGAIAAVAAGALVVGGTTAAVAAAPPVSSSEAAVQAGIDALAEASASPAAPVTSEESSGHPAAPSPTPTSPSPSPSACAAVADAGVADAGVADAAGAGSTDDSGETDVPGVADDFGSASAASGVSGASAIGTSPVAASGSPCTGRDGRPLPPAPVTVGGDRVSAIGDSVMLASAGGLLTALPGVQIDAAVSRSMWAGTGIVESLAAQGTLRDFVVVGLGTNGPVDAGALQEVYDAIGPQRSLVLVTAFAPRDWIPGVNAELTNFAGTHPRVVLADWSHAIEPQVDLLAGDRIHPGPTGGAIYAETVAAAIDGIENQRAQVRYQVDLIRWATSRTFDPTPGASR